MHFAFNNELLAWASQILSKVEAPILHKLQFMTNLAHAVGIGFFRLQ